MTMKGPDTTPRTEGREEVLDIVRQLYACSKRHGRSRDAIRSMGTTGKRTGSAVVYRSHLEAVARAVKALAQVQDELHAQHQINTLMGDVR